MPVLRRWSHQFIGWHFFITGKYSAFNDFAKAGCAEVHKISDDDSQKSIYFGRVVAQGFHQLAPAQCPEPVTQQQQQEVPESIASNEHDPAHL